MTQGANPLGNPVITNVQVSGPGLPDNGMLMLMVDFNAVRAGQVRGLRSELTGGEPVVGEEVLLDDGEGNSAWGKIARATGPLVYANVDWNSFGAQRVEQRQGWVAMPKVMIRYLAEPHGEPYSDVEVPDNEAGPVPTVRRDRRGQP